MRRDGATSWRKKEREKINAMMDGKKLVDRRLGSR